VNELQGNESSENPGKAPAVFHGYPPPYSNTIYAPNQFLSVVLPHASLNCIRLVAFLIEEALAWADGEEEPTDGSAWVPYSRIAKESCVSRSKLQSAIDEGIEGRYIIAERFGKPISPMHDGYPANYSLKWNTELYYTEESEEFDGFFGAPDGKDGNRTHIPKSFFDHTIPNEPKSVIQVVGAIMRYTIGFELKKGYRRKLVKMSWKRLQAETRIGSPNTLKDALDRAIKGHHIELLEEGVFDPQAGVNSRPAVYTLKWTDGAYMGETKKPEIVELDSALERGFPKLKRALPKTEAAISQNNSGPSVPEVKREAQIERPKTEAEAVPKVNREASQNRSDIEITLLNNSSETQQQRCAADDEGDFVFDLIQLLRGHGLSEDAAKKLVLKASPEIIRKQCEWIGQRVGVRNKQAFLWSAIVEDMPAPVQVSLFAQSEEEEFVEGFYEGWSAGKTSAVVPASSSELPAATRLIKSIRISVPDLNAREAGKRFGRFALAQERETKKPICAFIVQARNHGFAFVDSLADKIRSEKQAAMKKAREEHEAAFRETYLHFIDELEGAFATKHPAAFAEFIEKEAEERDRIEKRSHFGGEKIVARRLEYFDSPDAKRERFVEFFSARPETPIPSFWEWDTNNNPEGFKQEQPA
jgi:hypothetical protein